MISLATTFKKGLFTLLPAVILIALAQWIYRGLLETFAPLHEVVGIQQSIFFLLFILIALFVLIMFIGLVVQTKFGHSVFVFIEKWLLSFIPGYRQVKKVTQTFDGTSLQKSASRVVLVDLYDNGTYMTGFVTDIPTTDRTTVFIPTAPNPTSGLIYHVPNERIKPSNAKTQEAFESIIAVGKHSDVLFFDNKK